jgi:hypothetical protein
MFSLKYHTPSRATLDSLLLQLDEPSKRFPYVQCSFQINEFRETLRHALEPHHILLFHLRPRSRHLRKTLGSLNTAPAKIQVLTRGVNIENQTSEEVLRNLYQTCVAIKEMDDT